MEISRMHTISKLPAVRPFRGEADIKCSTLTAPISEDKLHWPPGSAQLDTASTPAQEQGDGQMKDVIKEQPAQNINIKIESESISPSTSRPPVTSTARVKAKTAQFMTAANSPGKSTSPSSSPGEMSLFENEKDQESTRHWVLAQTSPLSTDDKNPGLEVSPSIPPIRSFKSSRRDRSTKSAAVMAMHLDDTLRGLDGYNLQHGSNNKDMEEQSSDDSDLFLKLAREEAMASPRGPIRRSQISSNRQSLPPNHSVFRNSSQLLRRGSDVESNTGSRQGEERMAQALTYQPSGRERIPTALDISRQRFGGGASHSTPTTPRALTGREATSREILLPESQVSYGGRRPSIPEPGGLPSRTTSYRQSNLSYGIPRPYNSSPLVSRTTGTTDGVQDTSEVTRAAEGTESSVSTTAPSTVWDELEDLKSRIHRLELTGKLPTSSGAAISRASHERPPTATTTVTTMSSSPKHGRGNSLSPTEGPGMELPPNDTHPLLSAALAKSKPLLSPEVYDTLEATAKDALALASLMGSAGQLGPISSSQSTIGGGSNGVSDRQVRRKVDSMCRSLTELCLALSEKKTEQAQQKQGSLRPRSRDTELESVVEQDQRQPISTDLSRVKSSPRALSRLEARRSSLLATCALPSPRYAPTEVGTPTQNTMAGRRTSLLLRNRRAGTGEPEEEEDDSRFRAPSRATTEIGRIRNSPREYTSQQPMPDSRVQPIQSSLPVRRHYASASLGSSGGPPVSAAISNIAGRRYMDRVTPERDTTALAGRLAEDRTQRKSSIGQGYIPLGRTGSLTRRTRQPNMGEQ